MRADFPLEESARDTIRAEVMEEYLLRAYQKARNHMVTVKCERGTHTRCFNSGVTCLCLCHDRKNLRREERHGADG